MSGFSESSTVQAWLRDRLTDLGWKAVLPDALPRTNTDVVCDEWVIDALVRLNPAIAEQPDRVDEILPVLRSAILSASNEGLLAANERLTTLLRGDQTFKFIGTEHHFPVRFIDFDDPENNSSWSVRKWCTAR